MVSCSYLPVYRFRWAFQTHISIWSPLTHRVLLLSTETTIKRVTEHVRPMQTCEEFLSLLLVPVPATAEP